MNITEVNRSESSWKATIYNGIKNTCLWGTRAITIGGAVDVITCFTADLSKNRPHPLDYWDKLNICNYTNPTSPAFIYGLPVALLKGGNFSGFIDELCKAKTEILYTQLLFKKDFLENLFIFGMVIAIINVYYQVIWEDLFEKPQMTHNKIKVIEMTHPTLSPKTTPPT